MCRECVFILSWTEKTTGNNVGSWRETYYVYHYAIDSDDDLLYKIYQILMHSKQYYGVRLFF